MKLLLDQNLSRFLVHQLRDVYPESVHVVTVGLGTATDREVWKFAGSNGFTIVSKDADFNELAFVHGPPPKGRMATRWERADRHHQVRAARRRRSDRRVCRQRRGRCIGSAAHSASIRVAARRGVRTGHRVPAERLVFRFAFDMNTPSLTTATVGNLFEDLVPAKTSFRRDADLMLAAVPLLPIGA